MSECESFQKQYNWNFFISISLCVGIFISYIPQHIRIIQRKSSEGISPWFLLLGITSGFCSFFNILLVSKDIYHCCTLISPGNCFSASLGILQISVQAFAATLILVFALIFTRNQTLEPKDDYYRLQQVGKICLSFFLCAGCLALYTFCSKTKDEVSILANCFGVLGALLAALQYLPQIYTTTHLQHVGSLSIPMMCLQTPGGFAWSASLAAREGTKWSSWLPFFTAACLQGILLTLAIYFEFKNKRLARETQKLINGIETTYNTSNNPEITSLIEA